MKLVINILTISFIAAYTSAIDTSDVCKSVAMGATRPNPDSCGKFVICIDGQAIPSTCADGLHFNVLKWFCERPELAGCDKAVAQIERDAYWKCKILPSGSQLPIRGDCENFYVCNEGRTTIRSCMKPLHFNAEKLYCETAELAGCTVNVCKNQLNGVNLPVEGQCDKFYVCNEGNAVVKRCGNGFHFNANYKFCQTPKLAGCNETI